MVVLLAKGRRRLYWILGALVLIVEATALMVALPLQFHPLHFVVIAIFLMQVFWYFYYITHFRKEKLRYPLVPPEGKGDVYLPRTDIPRPIHEDMRHAREQRRKFAKLDKLRRKKKQR
jgi:hypothetical protein